MKNKRLTTKEITEKVAQDIIGCLEKGTIPWSLGYEHQYGNAVNFDGVPYTGMNRWITLSSVIKNEFTTNTWVTFNRVKKAGGHILKGSKSTTLTYWKPIKVKSIDKKSGSVIVDEDGKPKMKSIPFLRQFSVFNLCQTSLYDPSKVEKVREDVEVNTSLANQLVADWDSEVSIKFGYDNSASPYYAPLKDFINIPYNGEEDSGWDNDELMFKTTFHEMMHSTGHKSRLDRFDKATLDGIDAGKLHSRGQYSAEELVAEMGSQILADICDFKQNHIENTSAYIKSWLKCLKSNPEWLLYASGRAEKGVNLILDNSMEGGK